MRIPGDAASVMSAGATMRAAVLTAHGGADALSVQEVSRPTPGPGEVLVRVVAASVNYADVVRRRNDPYPFPTPPGSILGSEVAGTVEALGTGVEGLVPGDPVFALLPNGGLGGYAQFAVAPARQVLPLPGDLDLDAACTIAVAGVTALHALTVAGRLEPGQAVFIPGAVGGVGSYAVQIAKVLGAAPIIAGAGTEERRRHAIALGADHAVDYRDAGWPERVKALTGGRGADVVLDMIGGAFLHEALAALAPFGRLVTYGTASRERSTLVPQELMAKAQSVVGYYVAHWFTQRPRESIAAFRSVVELIRSGRIQVALAERLPLDGAATAHRLIEARQVRGKVILKPWAQSGS